MSKIEELDKLDRAIKDAEVNLKSIQTKTELMAKEIAVLGPRKNELEQNIQFHKRAGSIPIAHEYRKSKQELTKVKGRLTLITLDHSKALQAIKDVEQIIEKFKRDYDSLSKTSENNVLQGSFGDKRGKK